MMDVAKMIKVHELSEMEGKSGRKFVKGAPIIFNPLNSIIKAGEEFGSIVHFVRTFHTSLVYESPDEIWRLIHGEEEEQPKRKWKCWAAFSYDPQSETINPFSRAFEELREIMNCVQELALDIDQSHIGPWRKGEGEDCHMIDLYGFPHPDGPVPDLITWVVHPVWVTPGDDVYVLYHIDGENGCKLLNRFEFCSQQEALKSMASQLGVKLETLKGYEQSHWYDEEGRIWVIAQYKNPEKWGKK